MHQATVIIPSFFVVFRNTSESSEENAAFCTGGQVNFPISGFKVFDIKVSAPELQKHCSRIQTATCCFRCYAGYWHYKEKWRPFEASISKIFNLLLTAFFSHRIDELSVYFPMSSNSWKTLLDKINNFPVDARDYFSNAYSPSKLWKCFTPSKFWMNFTFVKQSMTVSLPLVSAWIISHSGWWGSCLNTLSVCRFWAVCLSKVVINRFFFFVSFMERTPILFLSTHFTGRDGLRWDALWTKNSVLHREICLKKD